MGCWGIKSYENDDAHEALDRGFERVYGDVYDDFRRAKRKYDPDSVLTPGQGIFPGPGC